MAPTDDLGKYMKLLLSFLAVFATTGAATAFECLAGVEGKIVPVKWTAERTDDQWTAVRITLRNDLGKDVRIAVSGAHFSGQVPAGTPRGGGMAIMEKVSAGDTKTVRFESNALGYLLDSDLSDFELHICLQSVSYADGSLEQF